MTPYNSLPSTRVTKPASSRPERGANRQLALASSGPREQQVRHVRAGNEQDERHCADEHEKDRPDIADDLVVEWVEIDEILPDAELCASAPHVRLSRTERDTRLESHDDVEIVA